MSLNYSEGILINVRDAAAVTAGLFYGGPAGVIAGFMGGLYRFVSVYWGGSGPYTQLACSI
jgi:LytS/YehU family sensor histidine kinase